MCSAWQAPAFAQSAYFPKRDLRPRINTLLTGKALNLADFQLFFAGFRPGIPFAFIAEAQVGTVMSFIFLILFFSFGAVALIFIYRGFPGSSRDMGWKMSGIWCNPNNLHVMLHCNQGRLKGHVVSSATDDRRDANLIIKELEVQPLWQWSDGTYVVPGSHEEHHVRLRLKGSRTLAVKFIPENKTEEWKLVDPL
jgi:hypothetical protein